MMVQRLDNRLSRIRQGEKEITVRSTLEARWALFFNKLELSWQHEPRSFDLSGGGRYTPDFHVEGVGWIEVKPTLDHLRESWPRIKRFMAEYTQEPPLYLLASKMPIGFRQDDVVRFKDGKINVPNEGMAYSIFMAAAQASALRITQAMQDANDAEISHMVPIQDVMRLETNKILNL